MNFKLGFGPMSKSVNEILACYAKTNQKPLMLIASRNQIDHNSGYVMTTRQLSQQLNDIKSEFIMLCRDHCGPYFLDSEKSLGLKQAIEATKKTIAGDIENGFNLIHIDTSRCNEPYQVADELFNFCLDLNPNIKFEFGTEENVGVAAGVKKYQEDVKFASQYPNMMFVVAQTGSLVMENRQIGSFDVALVKSLVNFAESSGIKLKEHNADYLTGKQIQLRKQAGVHACNIAPQLGVLQTATVLKTAYKYNINCVAFKNKVLSSNKWNKWIIDGDDEMKILVAGHYCFGTKEYLDLEYSLNRYCNLQKEITNSITDCLNLYYENLL